MAKNFDLRSFMAGLPLGLAGKPLPLAVQRWETLFEGEVTSRVEYNLAAVGIGMEYPGFAVGDIIRLTVNGESSVMTAVYKYSEADMVEHPTRREIMYVGNSDVGGGPRNGFTNENIIEYDYCLNQYITITEDVLGYKKGAYAYLYTKSEGTYSVKIEKLVKG